ncbi:MAG: ribonuclease HII, partial [Bacteroidota bacterium]
LDNAFLFSEKKGILERIISNYKNGHTWEKTALFKSAMEDMASESTILFLSKFTGMQQVFTEHLSPSLVKSFQGFPGSKSLYGAQVIADQNVFHTNALVKKIVDTKKRGGVSRIFSMDLGSELAIPPKFVTDHRNKTQEIVVQDVDNVLYLISKKGKIIWQKKLNGRIQGAIQQVDLFKNGRLQMAFTTNNEFLVLDRNGNRVSPFPIAFKGQNLNPLAVFDYEGKRNYRFVITQGERVFMYNNKGKIVNGFTYTKAKSPIVKAPKHIRIGPKDYLLFQLEDGSLEILNRVGKTRIPVKKKIDFSDNAVYAHKNRFIVTDNKGTLYEIDQKGKVLQTDLHLDQGHGMDATSRTLVLMDNNQLSIKGRKVELELGVYLVPKIFYLNNKIYVSVSDIQNQRIHLFDSNAKPISGFPVTGSSLADMADLKNKDRPALVVQDSKNSLVLYGMD